MPNVGNGGHEDTTSDFLSSSPPSIGTRRTLLSSQGAQRPERKQTNNVNSLALDDVSSRSRVGSLRESSPPIGISNNNNNNNKANARHWNGLKTARDLSNLIDLMPPLSIEQGTKRLILAKKLDRENLDKFMGSYQSSIGSLSQSSSSASLTVHIKCQLRDVTLARDTNNSKIANNNLTLLQASQISSSSDSEQVSFGKNFKKSNVPLAMANNRKSSSSTANSILIPIHLIVTDENDNRPNFIGWPYIIDLNETAQVGSLLQGNEIMAVDNDQQGPLSTIEYSIVPGNFWSDSFAFLNPLDARSLIVKDNRLLDYESQSKLSLKVLARDQGEPPNWAITTLYMNLLDQDDMGPVFSEDKYTGFIRDNRPGEKIDLLPRRMIAQDGDKTLSTPISYSFHRKTNESVHFDLDQDLGQLTLKKTLPNNGDNNKSFCLLVRASQIDNPSKFTLTALNLKLNVGKQHLMSTTSNKQQRASTVLTNETKYEREPKLEFPKFSYSNFTVEVSENAQIGSTILTASAVVNHHQATTTTNIEYQLLDNELGYLAIDKLTGRLTISKLLDYEMFRSISVRILATSESYDDFVDYETTTTATATNSAETGPRALIYPKLACDIARININLINYNDYTPEFSHEQYNFQLAISDLIANFEPVSSKLVLVDDESHYLTLSNEKIISSGNNNEKFIGKIDSLQDSLASPDETDEDQLDYKAIQLGRIFCADRDYGDKLTLRLTGSKASLFHLTQDGRLYLPLVNVSSFNSQENYQIDTAQFKDHNSNNQQARLWPAVKRFPQRRVNNHQPFISSFSATNTARRSENQQHTLDRSYLNYLLNELSNLGRLRLKVHATDSGQPEAKQSTALIVVTIISIDNFIIQKRASQPPVESLVKSDNLENNQVDAAMGQMIANENNKTVSSSRGELVDERYTLQAGESRHNQNQIMMIPSVNGKSFVHINPDIIGNLLSVSSQTLSNRSKDNDAILSVQTGERSWKSQMPDTLESSASTNMFISSSSLISNGSANQVNSNNRQDQPLPPPSLLLVDDEGAKLVAMPKAMEVYSKQVQEAADLQQKQQQVRDKKLRSDRDIVGKSSGNFWAKLSENLGLNYGNEPIHWSNIFTTTLLHLIVIIVIVSLATKIRYYVASSSSLSSGGTNDDRAGSGVLTLDVSDFEGSRRWPRRISNLGSFFVSKSTRRNTAANNSGCGQSASDILNRHQSTAYGNISSLTSHYNSAYESHKTLECNLFQQDNNHVVEDHQSRYRQQGIVSSGTVVSAMANHANRNKQQHQQQPQHQETSGNKQLEPSSEAKNQQNLFDHLKLTLNKMLDNQSEEHHQTGHVSVRPLDSDVVAYEDQRDRIIDDRAQFKETSEMQVQQMQGKKCFDDKSAAISTFVGNTSSSVCLRSPAHGREQQQQHNERADLQLVKGDYLNTSNDKSSKSHSTIVSINVVAPPKHHEALGSLRNCNSQDETKHSLAKSTKSHNSKSSSSSSSVVSMSASHSIASSLSNKISEAVERDANRDTVTGSDASSLNSSILLNSRNNSTSTLTDNKQQQDKQQSDSIYHRQGFKKKNAPPRPPPLPPAPSFVRAAITDQTSSSSSGSSPLISPNAYANGLLLSSGNSSSSSNISRAPIKCSKSPSNSRQAQPENPIYSKLRRETLQDQASNGSSGRNQTTIKGLTRANPSVRSTATTATTTTTTTTSDRKDSTTRAAASSDRVHRKQACPAVVGRRDSRNQSIDVYSVPPTPPPMPFLKKPAGQGNLADGRRQIVTAAAAVAAGPTTADTTVSPTTSVDRGYESLQSCDHHQHNNNHQLRHFSSLQDYDKANGLVTTAGLGCISQKCEQCTSLVADSYIYSTVKNVNNNHNHNGQVAGTNVTRMGHDNRGVTSSLSGVDYPHQQRASQTLKLLPSSSSQLNRGSRTISSNSREKQTLNTSNKTLDCDTEDDDFYYCQEDLINHADNRQISVGGLLSDYASHTYKQQQQQQQQQTSVTSATSIAKGQRSLQRSCPSSSLIRRQKQNSTKIKPMAKINNSGRQMQNPILIEAISSNDLSSYSCEYYQQQEQKQQVNISSQVCDIERQQHLYGRSIGTTQRGGFSSRDYLHQSPCVKPKLRATKSLCSSNQTMLLLNDNHSPGCQAGKKQLTWSDQVEMDPYL